MKCHSSVSKVSVLRTVARFTGSVRILSKTGFDPPFLSQDSCGTFTRSQRIIIINLLNNLFVKKKIISIILDKYNCDSNERKSNTVQFYTNLVASLVEKAINQSEYILIHSYIFVHVLWVQIFKANDI